MSRAELAVGDSGGEGDGDAGGGGDGVGVGAGLGLAFAGGGGGAGFGLTVNWIDAFPPQDPTDELVYHWYATACVPTLSVEIDRVSVAFCPTEWKLWVTT